MVTTCFQYTTAALVFFSTHIIYQEIIVIGLIRANESYMHIEQCGG